MKNNKNKKKRLNRFDRYERGMKIYNEMAKNFTYEELFSISKNIDSAEFEKRRKKWAVFSIRSYDNMFDIFYDIAHSKKAKRMFWRINIIMFLITLFFFFVWLGALFIMIANLISIYQYFLMDSDTWFKLLYLFATPLLIYYMFINIFFYKFAPSSDEDLGIDTSYVSNTTGFFDVKSLFFRWTYVRIREKNENRSSYKIYESETGTKYLVSNDNISWSSHVRNWYLVSKYIVCGKMKISDLPRHFEDQLFFFTTTKNYQPKKCKMKSKISPKISLNFFDTSIVIFALLYALTTILSLILLVIIFVI